MSLNKNKIVVYFLLFLSRFAFSQEVTQDSTQVEALSEVVVTGQYNPQSIKKSVHNVIVIKREQIDNQAANNLADLLNFNLNLTILPSSQTGKSTISFFGLDAQYFNILVDNIPLVSDNGLGNNIDLTQINLDDIERIEIVEGAMGVEYGANAVSGVINIITKKSIDSNWKLEALVQEETISDEYAWFDEGRHIQGLNLAHNFSDKWFAKIGFNRNQFAGFLNDRKGKDHYLNDSLRGYEWLPKTQLTSGAMVNYKTNRFNLNYKFEYFSETLNFYDQAVRSNYDVPSQTINPSSTDKIYTTKRLVNNLNLNGTLKSGGNYQASLSYQQQERDLNQFTYFILSETKTDEADTTYQSSKVFFSKGTMSNLLKSKAFNFQLGYEARYIEGFDTKASGDYTQNDKTHTQGNYALFGSSEFQLNNSISFRPGLRYEYNTKYRSKTTASLSARYLMPHGFELRANVGTSYRTPNFEELYYYFVDSNHDVRGNENLDPENGITAFINLKKRSYINNTSLLNSIKLSYIDVQDKIDLAVVNTLPLQYQYINIDKYTLWGLTSDNAINTDRWTLKLGATLQGISRVYNNEINGNDNFLYAYQINTSSTYHLKEWNTFITMLFKYQGPTQRYVQSNEDEDGNALFTQQTTDGYGWLDASAKKSFFKEKLTATLGARNLLDITSVNISNSSSGGTHSSGSQSLLLGYGRSFYLKLLYNLNF
ncbi:TonB-dependent siderophore receptor [Mangrovimonas sp. DI 80]|uniref:TonB-dependent receptor plug domain-containing protein n=1 Tax=Mangrovimonas sp. DI 80 TaxID=1779330 RepID=UPI000975F2A5|nr:TonB-dependent receptor [Mangrovimonas sp. DI 80]OMP32057.1 TonB-dependent receptor [Mangrovimonas sp. DI 80]